MLRRPLNPAIRSRSATASRRPAGSLPTASRRCSRNGSGRTMSTPRAGCSAALSSSSTTTIRAIRRQGRHRHRRVWHQPAGAPRRLNRGEWAALVRILSAVFGKRLIARARTVNTSTGKAQSVSYCSANTPPANAERADVHGSSYARSSFTEITGAAASFARDRRSIARWRTVTASLRSLTDIASISISSFSLALSS